MATMVPWYGRLRLHRSASVESTIWPTMASGPEHDVNQPVLIASAALILDMHIWVQQQVRGHECWFSPACLLVGRQVCAIMVAYCMQSRYALLQGWDTQLWVQHGKLQAGSAAVPLCQTHTGLTAVRAHCKGVCSVRGGTPAEHMHLPKLSAMSEQCGLLVASSAQVRRKLALKYLPGC